MSAEWGPRVRGFGAGTGEIRIGNQQMSAELSEAIIGDITLRRTIDAASTLEFALDDSAGRLRKHPLFQVASVITLDGLRFRLAQLAKRGMNLELIAEEELAYLLRQKRGPKKAFRDKMTRAEFCLSLAREVKKDVPYWSPQLTKPQPIESVKQARASRRKQPAKGISRNVKLTVKGAPATPTQIEMANELLDAAMSYNPPRRAVIALLCAATHESVMGTRGMSTPVDHDSIGVLQGRLMYNSRSDLLSVPYNVRKFFRDPWTGTPHGGAIEQANKGRTIGEICTSIQGNATGDVYTQWRSEAEAWLEAYGGAGGGGSTSVRGIERYAFQVERDETYWDAQRRLMEEVNWRRFVNRGRLYLATDNDLLSLRPGITVGPDTPGIDDVDWELDSRKKAHEATLIGRANTWAAPPGTPVILDESHGPAAGKWLIHSIDGYVGKDDISVKLKRRSKPLPEPAPETRSVSIGGGGRKASGGAGGGRMVSDLADLKLPSTAPGPHAWGGSGSIIDLFVTPFMLRQSGIERISSRKRSVSDPLTQQNPDSDHSEAHQLACAGDYPTTSGEAAARALAVAMGNPGWRPGSYDTFNIVVDGHTFRVQILWAVPDHHNHIHCGVRRV